MRFRGLDPRTRWLRWGLLAVALGMVRDRLKIAPNCAARTLEADLLPIAEIAQKTGRPVAAALFIGSSPIRQYAEDWTLDSIADHTRRAVEFAVAPRQPMAGA